MPFVTPTFNELNLYFGPKLPLEFETLGLAFIASPNLRADSAIGALSAIRYAKQNYDHVEVANIFDLGQSASKLDINYSSLNFLKFADKSIGSYSAAGQVQLTDAYWGPQLLNSAIKVSGIRIGATDSWYPTIQPGVVFRTGYVIAASGIEPQDSWLMRALDPGYLNDTNHYLVLIYSVPEVLYAATSSGDLGLSFPPTQAKYKVTKEIATPISPQTIGYDGNIDILQSIKINGTVRASGLFTGVQVGTGDPFIKQFDKEIKQIALRSAIAPDDLVELQYLNYNDYYVYSGFRDASGAWWPFDANPEYGHIIGYREGGYLEHSSVCLSNQVTLYAIPTAAIEYTFTEYSAAEQVSKGNVIGLLSLKAYRGIDYNETHYIRHTISSEPVEYINARDGGTVINTWGHAKFGRNFYDEINQFSGDIFNLNIPSMIPLGRFVLGAPAAVNSVKLADIRERGGGVPEAFPMIAVESQTDGLDKLRSFFDLGIWEGKAVKEGGVIEVQIALSLLKTDEDDTDPTTMLASEIYETVRSLIPPGIDFEIKYV